MIQVEGLVKEFRTDSGVVRAIDDVSLEVARGSFFTLLGPSGCGKTTTLRCVAGLERPTRGVISIAGTTVAAGGRAVPGHKRDIGMVFQSYAVWPHMSVFENVAFPLRVARRKISGDELRARVEGALDQVGLAGYGTRMATQLSGGQQQRLSLARAIVREPSCLLLDEPLSNLDAKLRDRMRGELARIQRRLGITSLYVTHDQVEALAMSDEIAVMESGRIVQRGTPWEIYYEPRNEFVAQFIGSTNLFRGRVTAIDEPGLTVVETELGPLRCGGRETAIGEEVVVGVRPEDVVLEKGGRTDTAASNVFDGVIELRQFGGGSTEYEVRTSSGAVVRARKSSRIDVEPNDRVVAQLPPESCRLIPVGAHPTE